MLLIRADRAQRQQERENVGDLLSAFLASFLNAQVARRTAKTRGKIFRRREGTSGGERSRRATLESDLSADVGAYTDGQGTFLCPLCCPSGMR